MILYDTKIRKCPKMKNPLEAETNLIRKVLKKIN